MLYVMSVVTIPPCGAALGRGKA
ncbi:MAG: IlvGEDA operon leader peptide [Klebsiella pneumoniae]|nr:IlvGEDA operon leader peptide [Klebsiella pneumoniae]